MTRGLPGWCAATLLSMIGLFNIFGTLTCGYLSTNFQKSYFKFYLFARGVVIALFIFLPPSPTIAILFGITFGFLWLATVLQQLEW